MTNTAAVLLTTARAAMRSPRVAERERAVKYEAGIRRLIAEIEGGDALSAGASANGGAPWREERGDQVASVQNRRASSSTPVSGRRANPQPSPAP